MLKPGKCYANNKIFKLFLRAENDNTHEYLEQGFSTFFPLSNPES